MESCKPVRTGCRGCPCVVQCPPADTFPALSRLCHRPILFIYVNQLYVFQRTGTWRAKRSSMKLASLTRLPSIDNPAMRGTAAQDLTIDPAVAQTKRRRMIVIGASAGLIVPLLTA